jgi:hypothetical protein
MPPKRVCKTCGLEAHTQEDLELFAINAPSKYGRANYCIVCNKERNRNYHYENKEKKNEKSRRWAAKNPDLIREAKKRWQKRNPDKLNAQTARRRASKKQATPVWADHEIINDFYLEAKYHNMEVDHIVPLQHKLVCGLHVEHNLQLLTKEQNCSKGNKLLPEYQNGR